MNSFSTELSIVIIFPSAGQIIPSPDGMILSGSLKKYMISKRIIKNNKENIDNPRNAVASHVVNIDIKIGR
jgi:hypothetical protein